MAIRVQCGECGKAYQLKDDAAGKQLKCKECGTTIKIPSRPKPKKPVADDEEDLFADLAAAESRAAAVEEPDDDEEDEFDEAPSRPARGKAKKKGKSKPKRPSAGMPASVMVATAVVGLLMLLQVIAAFVAAKKGNNPSGPGIQVGVAGLILGGLIGGHRLAWQWGRIISVFGGVLMGFATLTMMAAFGNLNMAPAEKTILVASMLLMVTFMATIFICLGQDSAKEHFGLICPDCGHSTKKANDFFFNQARCTHCGNVW